MWEWFTINGIWILIVSVVVLLLLLFVRPWVYKRIEKAVSKERLEKLRRRINLALLVIGGITLIIIALALAAIMASQEGVPIITIEAVQGWLLEHGSKLLVILVVGVGLWFALKEFLPPLVRRTLVRAKGESKEGIKKRTDTLLSALMGLGKVLIIVVVVFMVLSELDVPIGPVLAGFGVAGIAVGFGAQYLIRDLIAGIFIILENQYRVGDVARIADVAGLVEEVNLRKTVLRDLDGILHHIPNGEIKVASNFTRRFSRAHLNISVAYKEDLDKAMAIIRKTWEEMAEDPDWGSMLISKTPWLLRVDEFGDSGIVIKVVGETQPIKQWDVMGELRRRIKRVFDEEDIEIPWPHVKLYFGEQQVDKDLTCQACSRANLPGSKFCSNCGASLSQT